MGGRGGRRVADGCPTKSSMIEGCRVSGKGSGPGFHRGALPRAPCRGGRARRGVVGVALAGPSEVSEALWSVQLCVCMSWRLSTGLVPASISSMLFSDRGIRSGCGSWGRTQGSATSTPEKGRPPNILPDQSLTSSAGQPSCISARHGLPVTFYRRLATEIPIGDGRCSTVGHDLRAQRTALHDSAGRPFLRAGLSLRRVPRGRLVGGDLECDPGEGFFGGESGLG